MKKRVLQKALMRPLPPVSVTNNMLQPQDRQQQGT